MRGNGAPSIHRQLREREYGVRGLRLEGHLGDGEGERKREGLGFRLNQAWNGIARVTVQLHETLALRDNSGNPRWPAISAVVETIMSKLLSDSANDPAYHVSPIQKQQREVFVALGGMNALLSLFGPPFMMRDTATMPTVFFHEKTDLWNEVLVILREVSFAIPSLADSVYTKDRIATLFTLLSHQVVFENTMNLLEEVLAIRIETFSMADVPNLYNLLGRFSCRHLAHFCRVLALVLFEPEDRHIMESSQVLRSFELLQLRRDRMARAVNTVERNQSLIIEMPDMLHRLVSLMRIMNYGPTLHDLLRHNIVAQTPVTHELLSFLSGNSENYDWQHFLNLDRTVRTAGDETHAHGPAPPDAIMEQLLDAFSPNGGADAGAQVQNMNSLLSIMTMAEQLGIASMANIGGQVVISPHVGRRCDSVQAKKELQFHAMILQPHQVELLFVLCTLLSGRRKVDVQQRLAELGLADVLHDMFARMSWDAPPYSGPNPLEHIHGPNCECNPESALRVQYLRLVHNFYERDFENNPNKKLLLSPTEQEMLTHTSHESPESAIPLTDKGLLSKIVSTLLKEPSDSVYRFWLSSCLEAYLRGNGSQEQIFVARSGVLEHLLKHILNSGFKSAGNLQTAFDLLGELVKGNVQVMEMIDAALSNEQFQLFMDLILSNLVDSNVFLRCMYLTLERHSLHVASDEPLLANSCISTTKPSQTNPGYITHTWLQFAPQPVLPIASVSTGSSRRTSKTVRARTTFMRPQFQLGMLGTAIRGLTQLFETMRTNSRTQSEPETERERAPASPQYTDRGVYWQPQVVEVDEGGYATPPESVNAEFQTPQSSREDDRMKLDWETAEPWVEYPKGTSRIATYLSQSKYLLLKKLMSSVTSRTVNHENICCLNTTLIVLVFEYHRGRLAEALAIIRKLSEGATSSKDEHKDSNADPCVSSNTDAHIDTHTPIHSSEPYERECSHSRGSSSHVQDVFVNFRELLWFWCEYYLRRGRDRLSLEFSSHISFQRWKDVVDLLCADDGAPTSLLTSPIPVPLSPYQMPPRPSAATVMDLLNTDG